MGDGNLSKSLFSPAYSRFLAAFRRARVEAGLTQVEVARRLGRPQSFVSKCESGERRVDVVEFLAFCRVYGIAPTSILESIPEPGRRAATKGRRKDDS